MQNIFKVAQENLNEIQFENKLKIDLYKFIKFMYEGVFNDKGHFRVISNIFTNPELMTKVMILSPKKDLFSNAMIVTLPDISTAVWIKLYRLSIFMGRIGVMETIFPHCQQSFQHKCSAINEVMLTLSRFPPPVPASAGQAHVSAAAAHFLPGGRRLRAQKAPGAFAPGAGCYGAAVPAHAPMSWQ